MIVLSLILLLSLVGHVYQFIAWLNAQCAIDDLAEELAKYNPSI